MSKSKAAPAAPTAPAVLTENVPAGLTVKSNDAVRIVDNTDAAPAPERKVETQEVELTPGLKMVSYL